MLNTLNCKAMKKMILFFMIVFYSINTSMSHAQNNIVPVMDRFVVNVEWNNVNSKYAISRVYLTIKNLQTGTTYTARATNYTSLYNGRIQYTLCANQTFSNIRNDDRFEIIIQIQGVDGSNSYIKDQVSYAGISQPQLKERNTKYYCNIDGNTLSGITRSPIPITTLSLTNGYYK